MNKLGITKHKSTEKTKVSVFIKDLEKTRFYFSLMVKILMIVTVSATILALVNGIKTRKMKTDKELAEMHTQRALYHVQQKGHLGDAIVEYRKSLELDPSNSGVWNYYGYALLRVGKLNESVDALRKSVTLNNSNPWGHYNLAIALWMIGSQSDALDEVEETLEVSPDMGKVMLSDAQYNRFKKSSRYRKLLGLRIEGKE